MTQSSFKKHTYGYEAVSHASSPAGSISGAVFSEGIWQSLSAHKTHIRFSPAVHGQESRLRTEETHQGVPDTLFVVKRLWIQPNSAGGW